MQPSTPPQTWAYLKLNKSLSELVLTKAPSQIASLLYCIVLDRLIVPTNFVIFQSAGVRNNVLLSAALIPNHPRKQIHVLI